MKRILAFYDYLKFKNYSTIAGSIAFFFLMNGGAVLFLIFYFFRFFNFEFDINIQDGLIKETINYMISTKNYNGIPTLLFITSLWSSTTLFYHLIKSGEMIFERKRKNFTRFLRVLSLLMLILFVILMLSSIILIILTGYILSRIKSIMVKIFLELVIYLGLPILMILFFFFFVPPVKMKLYQVLPGTSLTLFYWVASTIFFRLYLKIFTNFKQIYVSLAFPIVIALFIYFISKGLIIGLCLNEKIWKNNLDERLENING